MTTKSNPALQQAAEDGFNGKAFSASEHGCPTSAKASAFYVGRRIAFLAGTAPSGVRSGRGMTVHANGHLWDVRWGASGAEPVVTIR